MFLMDEGRVEIESELTARKREPSARNTLHPSRCPTQAKIGLAWATVVRRFSELAVFDARLYIRVRRIDEPA